MRARRSGGAGTGGVATRERGAGGAERADGIDERCPGSLPASAAFRVAPGSHPLRSRRRTLVAAILSIGLLLLAAAPAGASEDDGDPGDILVTVPESSQGTEITNAQFRWGLNTESGGGAFAGGCNFLSAGKAGDSGGAVVWTESKGLYRAKDGNVRIEKPDRAGEYRPASFADRCSDAQGDPVSVASLTSATGNQVVIDGGIGRLVPGSGLEIRWKGSFTVVFYGGMTYWSVTDPVLTVDAGGAGRVTATASGYGASMEDLSKWEPLRPQSIVLAELRSVPLGAQRGFAVEPQYLGVAVPNAGQAARTAENTSYWGSFPASFVSFQKLTGQAGYWLTTNGQRDRAKVATTLYISYDGSAPIAVVPPPAGTSGGSDDDPSNPLRTRPAQPEPAAAQAPPGAMFPLANSTTAEPQGAGLLSDVLPQGWGPYVAPLLWILLAVSSATVAVMSIMRMLPWQRPA